jgi:hypothetical protein
MTVPQRRFDQITSLEERLSKESSRLRKVAKGTPPGIERDRLLRKAKQLESTVQISEWLRSTSTAADVPK